MAGLAGSSIAQTLSGQTILLTGATGFLGKATLEKLMRTCDDVRVYAIIRNKKGKQIEERVKEMLSDVVFDRVRREKPGFESRLFPMYGDAAEPQFGLSPEDRATLVREVTIVLHGAATVRFDAHLGTAIRINIRGVREMLELATEMPRLKAFVHVSTAFANCHLPEVLEQVGEKPPMSPHAALALAENLSSELLDKITPSVIDCWPNTYTFTKLVAENLVAEYRGRLPLVLYRPAIIVSSAFEPTPGWIDNVYGPTGVVAAVGMGLLRVMVSTSEAIGDMVPVDLVVNAMLAAVVDRMRESPVIPGEMPVYNYVSSPSNPLSWGEFRKLNLKFAPDLACNKAMWVPMITLCPSETVFELLHHVMHVFPAAIMDLVLSVVGKKPMMLDAYKRIHKFVMVIGFFANRTWRFQDDNVQQLIRSMNPKDREVFNSDMRTVDWETFFKNSLLGIRLYLVKDDPSTIPAGQRRYKVLKFLDTMLRLFLIALVLWMAWSLFTLFRSSWSAITTTRPGHAQITEVGDV